MNYGYIKVASAIPGVKVADCEYNLGQIESLIQQAVDKNAEIVVFPELCITGYTCQDLFQQQMLLDNADTALMMLTDATRKWDIICIVGMPVNLGHVLVNCAVVVQKGSIIGVVPKTFIPNYGEFYEKRWFVPARDIVETEITLAGNRLTISPDPVVFRTSEGVKFGIEICEDLWAPSSPSNNLALAGADIIFNLSASDELMGKHEYLRRLIQQQSAKCISGYVYSSCGFGESTQDVVFAGNAMICQDGRILAEAKRFSLDPQLIVAQIDIDVIRNRRCRNSTFGGCASGKKARLIDTLPVISNNSEFDVKVNPHPLIPSEDKMYESCEDILNIQAFGLAKRLTHIHCDKVIIGISGGLDSTLALLACVRTFDMLKYDRKGIIGVTMPGFGTTGRTYNNAINLMKNLGITIREINIAASVTQHFKDIGHDMEYKDVTYENSQARERTQILMDLGNKLGAIVIGTGDLSELVLGWATYNGDQMSMYGMNASIAKTLVVHLVRHVAMHCVDEDSKKILLDIIDTPISPELIPADEQGNIKQKTEDLVGPYELHDFFIYHVLHNNFRPVKIFMLAKEAFGKGLPGRGSYDDKTIKKWLSTFYRRFFTQQFKRTCMPDGPKTGLISLSPRGDWRMPTDASAEMWLKEVEKIEIENA